MSNHGDEICRFSAERKTFFFNKMQARNGNEYLAINALWGEGNRERLTLFPAQLVPFWDCLKKSVGKMTGFQPADEAPAYSGPSEEPPHCEYCGAGLDETICRRNEDGTQWWLLCKRCLDEDGQFKTVAKSSPLAPRHIDHNPKEYRP